jgi:hypothetical protein
MIDVTLHGSHEVVLVLVHDAGFAEGGERGQGWTTAIGVRKMATEVMVAQPAITTRGSPAVF